MPYIDKRDRVLLESHREMNPAAPGQLNYVLTMECVKYWESFNPSYAHINEVIGALECAKMEFYRRIAVPYENQKKEENGDVYFGSTEKATTPAPR